MIRSPASICFMLLLATAALCHGSTIYVPDDYPQIQDAIDASVNGDVIIVRPGTYVENLDFMGKGITVKSESGPDFTTIDGNQAGTVVLFDKGEGADSVLQGFFVTNGSGSGIVCTDSSPVIRENSITANSNVTWGGGIICQGADPLITDCQINQNLAGCSGGGIVCLHSAPTIDGNSFFSNQLTSSNTDGGAIACRNSNPTISRNHFSWNMADFGGAVHCWDSTPKLARNCITVNKAYAQGGGIFCSRSHPRIVENEITSNTSDYGGGIYLWDSDSVVSGNLISKNVTYKDSGGGIMCRDESSLELKGNTISKNSSGRHGGGVCFSNRTSAQLQDNCICANSAQVKGGGIYASENCDLLILNGIVCDNRGCDFGGGIYTRDQCSSTMLNSTFAGNRAWEKGGGLYATLDSFMSVTNTIFWDNSAPSGPAIYVGNTSRPSTVEISFSDVQGGQGSVFVKDGCTLDWGGGMIDADPLFVDAADGDFHIPFDSPCRSAGDRTAPGLPDTDFEGDPRTGLFAFPDMGADEFHTHFYINGTVTTGSSATGVIIGWPQTNPVMLLSGSGVLPSPRHTPFGAFWLLPPWNSRAHFNPMPDNGVRIIERIVVVPMPGSRIPLQALVGTELSNLLIVEPE